MMLFPDSSLITNCYVYLCNLCNVDRFKAATAVFFLNMEETESQYTDSTKFNMQLSQTAQHLGRFLNLRTRR